MSRPTLEEFASRKLESLERRHLRRRLSVTEQGERARVIERGTELVSFASNDYLGLAMDPALIRASREATARYGVGAGASRLITGNHPLYRELEERLARLKGSEDAVVFGSGYLTTLGVIPLFAGAADLIVVDELAHSCILAGSDLSRARIVKFAHNDIACAEAELKARRRDHRHCLIVTNGVFSMDGDLAPLPALAELARRYDAWLMTDDAHGTGVVGGGRGSTFAHDVPVDVPLQMGTLSKAVGSYGGYLCSSAPVVELIRNRARSFVYSTGLPPGAVAAAVAGLTIIANDPERVALPLARARAFTDALGLPRAESAIVPIRVGAATAALEASAALREAGFVVPAIRPPTVPAGTSRLRIAFSAAHSADDVASLVQAIRALDLPK